mmetsp:Transcript_93425/g.166225  ORF Transcript_93425/g.166225 Transcript_93425/m.166225 type:complete len:152 (-) Transcript_93425:56-511(-)|eukprot:CAMPEP_0197634598 /NCGR_PEP_ID=MMETSP1338-20131121/10648_1 /TAXON_ID=43686 ORGANISM="Pelagodinium beii, Strain RCC1491" /NCGR_SAMPLE_ID=MMETSP1338 /ASSEMBLY_ACC=CAM_ASM_000754 /LENGTH=151 /DNA_ID=CAMNT_0043206489 /DNA_START=59 /DNA_END=514 /DNA_ORIENTATION=+
MSPLDGSSVLAPPCEQSKGHCKSGWGRARRGKGKACRGRAAAQCKDSKVEEDVLEKPLQTRQLTGTESMPSKRCVSFDLAANEVHEVVPYSEIYGLHPRDFVFGKGYSLIPAFQHIPMDLLAARARAETGALSQEAMDSLPEEDSDSEEEA